MIILQGTPPAKTLSGKHLVMTPHYTAITYTYRFTDKSIHSNKTIITDCNVPKIKVSSSIKKMNKDRCVLGYKTIIPNRNILDS